MKRLCNETGLTLIELCLTLLILGLIIALAIPRLGRSYHSLRLKSTAEQIAEELEMTRKRSDLFDQAWRLRLLKSKQGYILEKKVENPWFPGQMSWQQVFRKDLPAGFSLDTKEKIIEWLPGGYVNQTQLILISENGERFEIQITKKGIHVLETQPS